MEGVAVRIPRKTSRSMVPARLEPLLLVVLGDRETPGDAATRLRHARGTARDSRSVDRRATGIEIDRQAVAIHPIRALRQRHCADHGDDPPTDIIYAILRVRGLVGARDSDVTDRIEPRDLGRAVADITGVVDGHAIRTELHLALANDDIS